MSHQEPTMNRCSKAAPRSRLFGGGSDGQPSSAGTANKKGSTAGNAAPATAFERRSQAAGSPAASVASAAGSKLSLAATKKSKTSQLLPAPARSASRRTGSKHGSGLGTAAAALDPESFGVNSEDFSSSENTDDSEESSSEEAQTRKKKDELRARIRGVLAAVVSVYFMCVVLDVVWGAVCLVMGAVFHSEKAHSVFWGERHVNVHHGHREGGSRMAEAPYGAAQRYAVPAISYGVATGENATDNRDAATNTRHDVAATDHTYRLEAHHELAETAGRRPEDYVYEGTSYFSRGVQTVARIPIHLLVVPLDFLARLVFNPFYTSKGAAAKAKAEGRGQGVPAEGGFFWRVPVPDWSDSWSIRSHEALFHIKWDALMKSKRDYTRAATDLGEAVRAFAHLEPTTVQPQVLAAARERVRQRQETMCGELDVCKQRLLRLNSQKQGLSWQRVQELQHPAANLHRGATGHGHCDHTLSADPLWSPAEGSDQNAGGVGTGRSLFGRSSSSVASASSTDAAVAEEASLVRLLCYRDDDDDAVWKAVPFASWWSDQAARDATKARSGSL